MVKIIPNHCTYWTFASDMMRDYDFAQDYPNWTVIGTSVLAMPGLLVEITCRGMLGFGIYVRQKELDS